MFNVTQVGSWPRSEKLLRALKDRRNGQMTRAQFDRVADDEVRRCVEDLRELLAEGTIVERKSWLRTWVKRISVEKKRGGTIEYSLPLAILKRDGRPAGGLSPVSVLSMSQIGCRARIRT